LNKNNLLLAFSKKPSEKQHKNKIKSQTSDSTSTKKTKKVLVPYEVSVYADIYFPLEEEAYLNLTRPGSLKDPLNNLQPRVMETDEEEEKTSESETNDE